MKFIILVDSPGRRFLADPELISSARAFPSTDDSTRAQVFANKESALRQAARCGGTLAKLDDQDAVVLDIARFVEWVRQGRLVSITEFLLENPSFSIPDRPAFLRAFRTTLSGPMKPYPGDPWPSDPIKTVSIANVRRATDLYKRQILSLDELRKIVLDSRNPRSFVYAWSRDKTLFTRVESLVHFDAHRASLAESVVNMSRDKPLLSFFRFVAPSRKETVRQLLVRQFSVKLRTTSAVDSFLLDFFKRFSFFFSRSDRESLEKIARVLHS